MNINVENVIIPKVFYGITNFFKRENQRERQFQDQNKVLDFKRNDKEARIWGKNTFEKNIKRLTSRERRELHEYTHMDSSINFYLENHGRIVEEFDKDISREDLEKYRKEYASRVENIDRTLAKNKTEKDFYVYQKLDERQFYPEIIPEGFKLRKPFNKLDSDAVEKIQREFIDNQLEYKEDGFINASLTQYPTGIIKEQVANPPVLLKIKIPRGSNALYIKEPINVKTGFNQVLGARNQNLKYQKISKIIVNGLETLLVEVDVINK